MIWLAMLIPILCVIISNIFYSRKITWWENVIPLSASFVCILVAKFLIEFSQVSDTEFWTNYVVEARYYERWDEWITETCYRTVTDSDGHEHTEAYDCSHREYHPERFEVTDDSATTTEVDQSTFDRLQNRFGNLVFHDLHRDFYKLDGDMYTSIWPNTENTIESMTTAHTYKNRIQASHTIINYPTVDPKTTFVFEYPSTRDAFNVPSILSKIDLGLHEANEQLCRVNALLGRWKQVRIWILVFPEGTTITDAQNQEAYWKGGNKNELVICLGLNNQTEILWTHVFSWTPKEEVKILIRDEIMQHRGEPIQWQSLIDFIRGTVEKDWKRREFAEFDYVTVDPSMASIVVVYLITLAVSVGCVIFSITNDVE